MPLQVNYNPAAVNVHRNLISTDWTLNKVLEQLSSGLRINRAADDAAGLAVSEKLRAQVRGLQQASRNAQDAISLVQVAEGALNEIHSILQRMRELAVQAANDTLTDSDRAQIQEEVDQLISQIGTIATNTQFNTLKLLDGTVTQLVFQIGANANETVTLNLSAVTPTDLGVANLSVSTRQNAEAAISTIDTAIGQVTSIRAEYGAFQNRLERIVSYNNLAAENQGTAESRIRNVDMAEAVIQMVRYQVLQQTGIAALSQANVAPQAILALLR